MDTRQNCRAFDSLAPARSRFRASRLCRWLPPAPFYETPIHEMASDTDARQFALTDRRLRFGFFHHWRANRLAFFNQLELAMFREPGSGRNQVTHDHVFLEAAQPIDFAERSRFSEHTSRILERSRRNKAVGFQ